jgi:tetratricopeptide (TPR) repeat protein
MSTTVPAEVPARPAWAQRVLPWAFAVSVGLLLWSFVAGAVYLLGMRGALPLWSDVLEGARLRAVRGDVAGATREYKSASTIDALDARADYELGTLLLNSGRLDEASRELERGVRAHPSDGHVLATLADVRLAQRRYREAIDLYHQALLISPREPALLNNLGTAYAGAGELGHAVEAYTASVAITPSYAAKNLERAQKELAQTSPAGRAR